MRIPQTPPKLEELMAEAAETGRMMQLFTLMREAKTPRHYLHWDKIRRHPTPEGINHREWWMMQKLSRLEALKPIGLRDLSGKPFQFAIAGLVMEELHQIDLGAGGLVSIPEPITNPQTRDRYLVRSLMEEAITSSQLEGAVTTRKVAKEMIRSGRKPRDNSEQMILNNYATMERIRDLKSSALTPELVFQIHRLVTEKTLDHPTAAGRFRAPNERRAVGDDFGQVYHDPPPAEELEERMVAMCAFANGKTPGYFLIAQTKVIRRAVRGFHGYIERKTAELRDAEARMRVLELFNHRQVEMIRNALKHPGQHYTFESHRKSHQVAYQTARTDVLDLAGRGVLEKRKQGKQMVFFAPADLTIRLKKLEKQSGL